MTQYKQQCTEQSKAGAVRVTEWLFHRVSTLWPKTYWTELPLNTSKYHILYHLTEFLYFYIFMIQSINRDGFRSFLVKPSSTFQALLHLYTPTGSSHARARVCMFVCFVCDDFYFILI